MAHGTPDWAVTAGGVTTYQLTDLAELAARLGSPVTFDRRGDVIFLENFEDGQDMWPATLSAGGGALDLSTNRHRNGRYSLRFVAGSAGAYQASAFRDFPFPVLSGMGAEWNFDLATPFDYVELWLDLYDGTELTQFRIRYTYVGYLLQYQPASGPWVDIASDKSPQGSLVQFNSLKLVVDGPNDEYARLIVNSRTYSLAGIAAKRETEDTGPKLQIGVDFRGRADCNDILYLDAVIGTQNEPV